MGTLILLRHGESTWNRQNRFTGWVDVSLSPDGMAQAARAGELLQDVRLDVVYTSTLLRAQDTTYEVLKRNRHCPHYLRVHEADRPWYAHFTPQPEDCDELLVHVSESLNERYYGDLQGLNKEDAAKRFGAEQVHSWRRSYDIAPPGGESLKATAERVLPYYREHIVPRLLAGQCVLVSAHGNSLRALAMDIEALSPEQIAAYELATGAPHVYRLDAGMHLQGKEILAP